MIRRIDEVLADVLSRLSIEQDNVEIIFIPMSHPEDTKEAKDYCISYMPDRTLLC